MKTLKQITIFLIFISICGCATASNRFINIYNDSVASRQSKVIIREGDFVNIKNNVNAHLKTVGYSKVLSSSPQEGFMVLAKDIPLTKAMLIGDHHPYKIILKYTKAGKGETRIDLVNGSEILLARDEVERDISKIVELIEKD